MEAIREAVDHIYNRPVRKWKENGGKVVATLCTFVPSEIFMAAGIHPLRFRGVEAADLDIADAYYGPFICSCPKALLQMICEGKYAFLDGAIITPGCDSMRRLDDCWQKAGEDYQGIVPPFFFHFGVPHKAVSYSIDWFTDEIRRLINALEAHFGVPITDEKLQAAIRVYNHGRNLLQRIQDFRTDEDVKISGTDAFAIAIAGTALPREALNRTLESLIGELKQKEGSLAEGRKRIMVIGSVCDDTSLIELIENAGAVVVADNLCFGARPIGGMVSDTGDPVRALAEWYLEESVCPRMFGNFERRLAILKDRIRQCRVDGVIMQNIRFCDMHGSENGLFARSLAEINVPCLQVELEYGPLVDGGRVKMRVDAFLERIS
jgi:bcr-type benzoyl-CoA reductase subunit C